MKIHHTAICVDDINEAIDWYCSKLNLRLNIEIYRALLSFENSKIALVLPEQHLTSPSSKKASILLNTEHRDGTVSVYISDPFGNTIELLELPRA